MNKIQNNIYRMSTVTLNLIKEYREIVEPFFLISEQIEKIQALLKEIKFHENGQAAGDTVAKTQTKNELLAELVRRTYKLARKISGLAKLTNDNDLLYQVQFSPSEIADGSDLKTLNTVNKILQAAKSKEAILAQDYNMAEGEIDDLQAIASRVDSILDERLVSSSTGKASTANLSEAFSELREVWSVMDDLIEGIIENEDFIETYENTRKISY
jgi:hypothetical protein